MAELLKCIVCGRDVSSEAPFCPGCGEVNFTEERKNQAIQAQKQAEEEQELAWKRQVWEQYRKEWHEFTPISEGSSSCPVCGTPKKGEEMWINRVSMFLWRWKKDCECTWEDYADKKGISPDFPFFYADEQERIAAEEREERDRKAREKIREQRPIEKKKREEQERIQAEAAREAAQAAREKEEAAKRVREAEQRTKENKIKRFAFLGVFLQLSIMIAFFYILWGTEIIRSMFFSNISTSTEIFYLITIPCVISLILALIGLLFLKGDNNLWGIFFFFCIAIATGITFFVWGGDYGGVFGTIIIVIIYAIIMAIPAIPGLIIINKARHNEIWNEKATIKVLAIVIAVIGIVMGCFAYYSQENSLSIPYGVTVINEGEYSGKRLYSIDIPNSVTSIGENAFSNNRLTTIVIGANVTIENNAFGSSFEAFYTNNGKAAGTYKRPDTKSTDWSHY